MTARKLAKVQLCPHCRMDGGWHYDEDGNASRCPNITAVEPTAEQERDAAIKGTADAHPNALAAALRVITDTAARFETFSANTCRVEMDIAQVPGPVIGAAFGQAVGDGIIRRDGYVQSSKQNTHGHDIKQWRSLIYRGGVA